MFDKTNEEKLIHDFRLLSEEGQRFMLEVAGMAKLRYLNDEEKEEYVITAFDGFERAAMVDTIRASSEKEAITEFGEKYKDCERAYDILSVVSVGKDNV